MISPYKIKWDGLTSLELDVHVGCAFDSDDGETDTFLSKEAIASEMYSGEVKRTYSYKWSDVFAPTFTFVKEDFSDFTPEENRKILSWLTSKYKPEFLDVYKDDSDIIEFSILGNFTEVQQYKYGNGRIVGYVATFESLMPYALSPIRTITQNILTPQTFNIVNNSDENNRLLYPKVTIKQSNSVVVQSLKPMDQENFAEHIPGTVYKYGEFYYWIDNNGTLHQNKTNSSGFNTTGVLIENITTKSRTIVGNNITGEVITLDGANRVISTNRNNGRIFGEDFNWNWLGLQKGINKIRVTGNCEITIEYREPMKVGEMVLNAFKNS